MNSPIDEDNYDKPHLVAGWQGLIVCPIFKDSIIFSAIWASMSLKGQQYPMDNVVGFPIVSGCEGTPITVQASGFQKCRTDTADG